MIAVLDVRALCSPALSSEPQRRADQFLLGADTPQHAPIRACYTRALAAIPIDPARVVDAAVTALARRLEDAGVAELHVDLANPILARLIAGYLGVDHATARRLASAGRVAARIGAGELVADRSALATLAELDAALATVVDANTHLPAALRATGLPRAAVASLTRLTVIGAAETTARLLAATAVHCLERSGSPVRSALAQHPPLRYVLRRARCDADVGGIAIAAGTLVRVTLAGAPFGAGAHRCPGRAHALALARQLPDAIGAARATLGETIYGAPSSQLGGPEVVHVQR